ncbi:hypothetical protein FZEAL_4940 [Fusarium zealandicum]|uniref:Uncharacterized protein n=1 Tax=Fusarium zealandicum TaxID=1053134 RepID=A0A8H4UKR6_9HYPO|nr:hypothetical protein FZEAL_4940 [Fusarium zealandicum]
MFQSLSRQSGAGRDAGRPDEEGRWKPSPDHPASRRLLRAPPTSVLPVERTREGRDGESVEIQCTHRPDVVVHVDGALIDGVSDLERLGPRAHLGWQWETRQNGAVDDFAWWRMGRRLGAYLIPAAPPA